VKNLVNEVFEIDIVSRVAKNVKREENKDDEYFSHRIAPSKDINFVEIQSYPDGSYTFLRSDRELFIYNKNWDELSRKDVPPNTRYFKVFRTDRNEDMVVLFSDSGVICY
jgi:hypothetical protein